MSKWIQVRVAVVVLRGGEVLLVRHVTKRGDWWCLPGGAVEPGETLKECGIRELKEETGLDVEIAKLLYIGDFVQSDRHVLDLFFLGRIVGGELAMEERSHVRELRFVELQTVGSMGVEPRSVIRRIVKDAEQGFAAGGVYVGRYG